MAYLHCGWSGIFLIRRIFNERCIGFPGFATGIRFQAGSSQITEGRSAVVIEDLDTTLQNKQTRTDDLNQQIEKLQADRRIFEREAEASKAQLKKYQDQLYTVQNNKEYDALGTEIDTKKMEVESLESKILQTIEDEEALKNEIKGLTGDVSDIDSQLKENRQELEEIDLQTREEEGVILAKREEIALQIEDRYIRGLRTDSQSQKRTGHCPDRTKLLRRLFLSHSTAKNCRGQTSQTHF